MAEPTLREETLFAQACEIPSEEERTKFLERACAGDDALRREVEALLQADQRTGDLLDLPDTRADSPDAPCTELPGAVVGAYTLRRQIGEGGMGVVWLAEQTRPVKRRVALKIIKPGMDSRQVIARFAIERHALAAMDHPNIAKICDAGTTVSGRPYFVMELVEGLPIATFCDHNRLSVRRRLELFLRVCHAVQHAHQKGIIHRDLKSSNVLVALYDDEPVPKVIDFGVAKATGPMLAERVTCTQTGQLVGSIETLSPEQASFNPGDIDTRSDVYSLGALAYELLTGTTPFDRRRMVDATLAEVLRIIREEEPSRPSARLKALARENDTQLARLAECRRTTPAGLIGMLRGELDWILLKALENDRTRRYQTANALAMDVQRHLAHEPVAACPPSLRYRAHKLVSRNRGAVVAAMFVVFALIAGIAGTTAGMLRAHREARRAESALAAAKRSERLATDRLFEALVSQARAGRAVRRMGQRLDSLNALARAAEIRRDERLRDEVIATMALPDLSPVPAGRELPHGSMAAAFGANYTVYARFESDGAITIRDVATRKPRLRIATDQRPEFLEFGARDRFLIGFGTNSPLRVWRTADGRLIVRDDEPMPRARAFSLDGTRLAIGVRERLKCFDLTTGRESAQWPLPSPPHWLDFHPDGRRLAVGYDMAEVTSVYDVTCGALVANLPVGPVSSQMVAWHPDGERLAVSGDAPRIQIWNTRTMHQVARLEGHTRNVTRLSFHPSGDLVASHSWDGLVLLWHPSSRQPWMRLTSPHYPRFSEDGLWLGITRPGEPSLLLEVTPNPEYTTLFTSDGITSGDRGAISMDGRVLALGNQAGAHLWELKTGRELGRLPAGTAYIAFGTQPTHGPIAPGRPANAPGWHILTGGRDGLQRWPVDSVDAHGRRLRVGPPEPLAPQKRAWFAQGVDGRTLAAATVEGGPNTILDLGSRKAPRVLGPHPSGEVTALSPDGRWAASCGWHSDRVRLWNMASGRIAREWIDGKQNFVFFTPNSRELVIAHGDGFRFWDVNRLELTRRLTRDVAQFPGWAAFSPDARLMALEMAPGVIHLKDTSTGRTVAKLEDPHCQRSTWQGFTPDGAKLVVATGHAGEIHVWNLRAIRAGLKALNLDWDWPEFEAARTDENTEPVASLEVMQRDAKSCDGS